MLSLNVETKKRLMCCVASFMSLKIADIYHNPVSILSLCMRRIAAGLSVSFTFKTTLKSPPMITAAGTDVEDQDEQEAVAH